MGPLEVEISTCGRPVIGSGVVDIASVTAGFSDTLPVGRIFCRGFLKIRIPPMIITAAMMKLRRVNTSR